MIQPKHLLTAAIAALGLGAGALSIAAVAADPSNDQVVHAIKHREHHQGPRGPFLRAVHQLDLTDDQKQRIRSMLDTQRETMRASLDAQRANRAALANPGDPGYVAAVSAAKLAAANEVQRASDLEVQIYGILTAEQQAQLPKVLADLRNKSWAGNRRHRRPENLGPV